MANEAPAGATNEAPPAGASVDDDDDADDDSSEPVAPRDTPGARFEEQAPTPGGTSTTKEAARLLAAGRIDPAIQMLYAVRRRSKRNSDVALLLGHAYFRKQWRADGLREYDTAIKLSPGLRRNGTLIRNTVGALEGQTYRYARAVIRVRIGAPALPEVRRLARTTRSPKLRVRAVRLAAKLSHGRRR
jgi:hypothetical protein